MKTRLIPLITAVCFGASLIAFGAPPKKKKPDPVPGPGVVVPVPVPVPVPVVPAPKPAPPPAAKRFCGVERPHASHNFTIRGVVFRCPGKVAGPPKGPPRRP